MNAATYQPASTTAVPEMQSANLSLQILKHYHSFLLAVPFTVDNNGAHGYSPTRELMNLQRPPPFPPVLDGCPPIQFHILNHMLVRSAPHTPPARNCDATFVTGVVRKYLQFGPRRSIVESPEL
ncbi:uncharacterized protein TEOVI_000261700 [Trypanosoma equiperdum]|uniref:Uncharacterized protein n=2 Tax=Trypanozoon TaxID=39700 RepID=Q38D09_TRYB2|nr:hypothetical protein, unlikely [Trypanosoma brucei brucei TREU927]EAN77311.1 hypothetical protein, unlikely [Trypanosoma brucei brucei TREU927]SCU71037.1 hypothetical protein, conserved [Trypanosoma equiperdum]